MSLRFKGNDYQLGDEKSRIGLEMHQRLYDRICSMGRTRVTHVAVRVATRASQRDVRHVEQFDQTYISRVTHSRFKLRQIIHIYFNSFHSSTLLFILFHTFI